MRIPKSKITRYTTKKIIKHFSVDVTASQCSELTEINRNTINRYYNLFREVIYTHQQQKLHELYWWEVELDESYFGRWRWRWTIKQPVFWIYERNGEVYTEIIPNCKAKTLRRIILWKVSIDSVIYTDWWRWYNWLVDMWYEKHLRVHHGKNEFARWKTHINWIENFWSFTKRRLKKFNGVKKNFDLHLKECEFRYKKSHAEIEKELTILVTNYFS